MENGPEERPPSVAILGASVRAAADSARRAGFAPVAVDLFADWDLARRGPAYLLPLDEYPAGFVRFILHLRGRPWLYTGGLENAPDLLTALEEIGPLWGNPAEVVTKVRHPAQLRQRLASLLPTPLFFPDLADPADPPAEGTWLAKPAAGSGGHGITAWKPGLSVPAATGHLIRRHAGRPCSSLYLADANRVTLIGHSLQFIGDLNCPEHPFIYAGNAGPLLVPPPLADALATLGTMLGEQFALRGLFGVDWLWIDGDRAAILEVNPRYTASVEVYERAWRLTGPASLLARHAAAFTLIPIRSVTMATPRESRNLPLPGDALPADVANADRPADAAAAAVDAMDQNRATGSFVAKGILFAQRACRVAVNAPCYRDEEGSFADLPSPGVPVAAGEPILTILESGSTLEEATHRLAAARAEFEARWLEPIASSALSPKNDDPSNGPC